MECTQKLECTQELYDRHKERIHPEQIGFLGICGTKYPVAKGPNKIGRDPQTCNIVLNLNSISRQHAVINILSNTNYMLMDLGSANKTKLENKTLESYIPHPLKNGDMVQFGDIFGVFRLLQDDDVLPMTQAINIPETPVPSRYTSKLKAPVTTIPESPDVSDKEDSFIILSKEPYFQNTQPKKNKPKLSDSQFITPFGKTLPIRPVSSPSTDSKQSSRPTSSLSFMDNSNTSLKVSSPSFKSDESHSETREMNTQSPVLCINEKTDTIYTADTQIPEEMTSLSTNIHNLDTQIPSIIRDSNLSEMQKISKQKNIKFDLFVANKENEISIFNAETQPLAFNESLEMRKTDAKSPPKNMSTKTINTSDEEVPFDDIDGDTFDEDFYSQALLPSELPFLGVENFNENAANETTKKRNKSDPEPSKRVLRVQSNDTTNCEESNESTNCEDEILLTQKISKSPIKEITEQLSKSTCVQSDSSHCEDFDKIIMQKVPNLTVKENIKDTDVLTETVIVKSAKRINRIVSDSSTDCEDNDIMPTQKNCIIEKKELQDDDLTDCEDLVEIDQSKRVKIESKGDIRKKNENIDNQTVQPKVDQSFEDMPTQIIEIIENESSTSKNDINIHEIATQILEENVPKEQTVKEIGGLFKIPLQSPIKSKYKDILKQTPNYTVTKQVTDNENFYNSTQDIYDDLCSQREASSDISKIGNCETNQICSDIELVPSTVKDYIVCDRFSNIDKGFTSEHIVVDFSSNECENKMKKYVENLTKKDIREIIGVKDSFRSDLKRYPSEQSDSESTPKKVCPYRFSDVDLPNSQEIKTTVSFKHRIPINESSSESESENYSEEQYTPILFHKKKRNSSAKLDLTKKFDIDKLPDCVISRVRKPTLKLGENAELRKDFLKPTFLIEPEEQIDKDIVVENIKRLKEKSKNNKCTKTEKKINPIKESTSRGTINKSNATKEKIKVKIEKPKKKETKKKDSKKKDTTESDKTTKQKSIDISIAESIHNSRSTRSKTKVNDSHSIENKPISVDTKSKHSEAKYNKYKRHMKQDTQDKSKTEVRRSKRKKIVEEKQEIIAPKSILKSSTHEQSTVYNISLSSVESPKSVKRCAMDDIGLSDKRMRPVISSGSSHVSLRATPARLMKTQYVLFTAFPSEEVKHKLEKLGAVIVADVMACTVVLTMQIKRTFKLLCAVGLGRPIVGPNWVQNCIDTHTIVDPWLYLIKDEVTEKRFQFSLQKSLTSKRKYLKGYNISSTPSVQPNATEMKLIVECSGGTWREGGPNWICVSCNADCSLWPELRKQGAILVSTELILSGVLRQTLDIAAHQFK